MRYQYENTDYHYLDKQWFTTPEGSKTRSPLPYTYKEGNVLSRGSGVSEKAGSLSCVYHWTQPNANPNFAPLKNKCISKLRNKLRGDTASWGVNVMEYRETLSLLTEMIGAVRHPLDSIVKVAEKAVKKGSVGSTADFIISRSINAHLAWKFGVEPLLEDIKSTVDLFSRSHRSTIYLRTSAHTSEDYTYEWNPWGHESGSGTNGVAAGISLQLTNYDVFLAENLGIYNLPAVLADAIPLSFVVDWFFPIVTWIKNCTWLAGCTVSPSGTWCTEYAKGSSTLNMKDGWKHLHADYSGWGIHVRRLVGDAAGLSLPSPPKEVSYKKFLKSDGKITTAAELTAQRVINVLERVHK